MPGGVGLAGASPCTKEEGDDLDVAPLACGVERGRAVSAGERRVCAGAQEQRGGGGMAFMASGEEGRAALARALVHSRAGLQGLRHLGGAAVESRDPQ